MKTYVIEWEVELSATSHREAAEEARRMQLDAYSEATFFTVTCTDSVGNAVAIDVDLLEDV
tara:strand:+ start:792 stop:974 length:183 start_codon:yes stop_codon:yes gene_type:complete